MGKKTLEKWSEVLRRYDIYRLHNFAAEADRAEYLDWIKAYEPWLDNDRYATLAAYNINKDRTWRSIVIHDLKENFSEVENTIAVFNYFGKAKMEKWGKSILLQIMNRIPDQAQDTLNKVFDDLNAYVTKYDCVPTSRMVARILDRYVPRMHRNPTVSEVDALREQAKSYKKKYEREHKINGKFVDSMAKIAEIAVACPKCDKAVEKVLKALAVTIASIK